MCDLRCGWLVRRTCNLLEARLLLLTLALEIPLWNNEISSEESERSCVFNPRLRRLPFGFGMLGRRLITNRTSVFEGIHYLRFSLPSIRIAARSMNQIDVGHYRFRAELDIWHKLLFVNTCAIWVTEYLTIPGQKPAGFQERGRMPTEAPELLWRKPYPDQYKRCVVLDAGELQECFQVSFVPNK